MEKNVVMQMLEAQKMVLIARREEMLKRMAQEWLKIDRSVQDDLLLLAYEVSTRRSQGKPVSRDAISSLERYKSLQKKINAQAAEFEEWCEEYITNEQEELAQAGLSDAWTVLVLSLATAGIAALSVAALEAEATKNLIGLAGDGNPLKVYLTLSGPFGLIEQGIYKELNEGIMRGMDPQLIAQNMANGMTGGLQQAMDTAGAETLRVYREASLMQYQNSGVVSGYRRMSARDDRVCAGCLFADGMLIEDLSHFDEHPNGRCTAVPVVMGAEKYSQFETGADWFLKQSEEEQLSILGPGRFAAWQDGASLDSMWTLKKTDEWGSYYMPTPVSFFEE